MNVHVSRIFAVVLVVILFFVNFMILVTQNSVTLDDESIDEGILPNPIYGRGTRAGTDWPMYRGDLPHSGFGTTSVPDENSILWSNTTGNGDGYGSPVVAEGKVFIGSADGYIYCFDLDTGDRLWRTYLSSGDFGIPGTPAVANDHVVVFCAGNDKVYRLRVSDGGINWSFGSGSGAYGGSSPAIHNDRVYIGSGNRTFYCLNETTGSEIWKYTTDPGSVRNYGIQSSPAVANGRIFVGACDGYLYCFNESQPSAPLADYYWRTNLFDAVFASPAVSNGRVYCGSGYYVYSEGTSSHTMFCLDELTGSVIWSYVTGSDILSSPAIAYDNCYFTSTDGELYCVDAMSGGPTPTFIWSNTTGDTWSSPSVADGKVVVGSRGTNSVYCFNATTGAPVWSLNVANDVYSSPAIADGKVVVGVRGSPESVICFGTSLVYTVDSIEIRNAPGGVGQPILNQNIGVGEPITGFAAAYNDTQGFLYDIPVNWSVANGGGANASTNPLLSVISSDFYSGFYGGIANWTADDGNGHMYSVDFIIDPPEIAIIRIVDTEGIGTNVIPDQSVDVGFTIQGYAAAFNDSIGYMGDVIVNWSVSNTSGAQAFTAPLQASNSTFNASFSGGNAIWTADDGNGHTYIVRFTVRNPTADSILIVDTPDIGGTDITDQTVDVGFTIQGYAAGFNDTLGYMGEVPVTWSVVNSSGAAGFTSPISGLNSELDVGAKGGTVQWTADDGFGHTDSVNFTVNPPELDYIIIRTGPNGTGSWVGDSTYVYGSSDTFYAAGYNDTVGWIEDVDATWNSDSPSIGDVIPGPANSTTFTAFNNGTCTITATNNSHSNSTGVITIINYTVDYIMIRDSQGGGGAPVGDLFFNVGETGTFYAAAYNDTGGYLGDVAVEWECSNLTVGTVTTPGVSTLFSAQFVSGECNITATYGSTITNKTGPLTIIEATLDYIVITDSPDGNAIAPLFYLDVGEITTLYASGYNNTGPTFVGLVEVNWSQSPFTIGSFDSSSGPQTTFTAGLSGGETDIIAENVTLSVIDDFTLRINDPMPDYIEIRDAAGGAGTLVTTASFTLGGVVIATYYCAPYNLTSGYIQDVPAIWSVSGGIGDVNPSSGTSTEFTATTVGIGNLNATYNSLTYSSEITVNPAPDTTPPAAPTGLDVRQVIAGGALRLEWNANSEEDLAGYNIYRTTTNGTGWVLVNTGLVTETTYQDLGLENGTTYYYYITAVDDATIPNESNPSDTVNNTCDVDTDGDGTYNLEDDDDDNDGLSDVEEAAIRTDPLNIDTDGDNYNDLVDFYPLDPTRWVEENPPPEAPTNVLVTAVTTGNTLNISWDANTEDDLAGYNLFRSLIQSSEFRQVNTVLITSELFIDGSLVNGVTYYYYVIAVDTANQSSNNSDVASGVPDLDTDADGLLNFEDTDDDNDNVTDADEIAQGTDPLLNDTDADGYNDDVDYYPLDSERWEAPGVDDTSDDESGFPFLLLLIPIIIVVVIFLIILLTKKRKPQEAPIPRETPKRTLPPPPKQKQETPTSEQQDLQPQEDDDFDEKELPPPDDFDEDALPPPDD